MWPIQSHEYLMFLFLICLYFCSQQNLFEALLCINVSMDSPFYAVVVTCDSELYF